MKSWARVAPSFAVIYLPFHTGLAAGRPSGRGSAAARGSFAGAASVFAAARVACRSVARTKGNWAP